MNTLLVINMVLAIFYSHYKKEIERNTLELFVNFDGGEI
jgi:hypothetical protein